MLCYGYKYQDILKIQGGPCPLPIPQATEPQKTLARPPQEATQPVWSTVLVPPLGLREQGAPICLPQLLGFQP